MARRIKEKRRRTEPLPRGHPKMLEPLPILDSLLADKSSFERHEFLVHSLHPPSGLHNFLDQLPVLLRLKVTVIFIMVPDPVGVLLPLLLHPLGEPANARFEPVTSSKVLRMTMLEFERSTLAGTT